MNRSLGWEGPNELKDSPKSYSKSDASNEFRGKERNLANVTPTSALVNLSVKLAEVIDCKQFNNVTKLLRVKAPPSKCI